MKYQIPHLLLFYLPFLFQFLFYLKKYQLISFAKPSLDFSVKIISKFSNNSSLLLALYSSTAVWFTSLIVTLMLILVLFLDFLIRYVSTFVLCSNTFFSKYALAIEKSSIQRPLEHIQKTKNKYRI